MTEMRDTRWSVGPIDLGGSLPPELAGYEGLAPLRATVDPAVPKEWLLLIIDPRLTKKGYPALRGFRLEVRMVALETDAGPLGVLMFGLCPPGTTEPAYIYPLHFSPEKLANADWLDVLAAQSHWHVLLLGRGRKTIDIVELANDFGLDDQVARMRELVKGPAGDLRLAIAQLRSWHSLRELWAKPESEPEPGPEPGGPLPAHVLEGLGRGLVLHYAVGRSEIEACDVSRVLEILGQLRAETIGGRSAMGALDVSLHGYDEDSRPLYQDPLVRRWCAALVSDTPDLLFFAASTSKLPRLALLSTIAMKVLPSGEIGFHGDGADRFLRRQAAGMNDLLRRAGIDPQSPVLRDHLAAVMGSFKNLQDI